MNINKNPEQPNIYQSKEDKPSYSRRKVLKIIGSGLLGFGMSTGYDILKDTRAEAKKFSYPTVEQQKSVANLTLESKSNPEIFQGIRMVVDISEQKVYLYKNSLEGQPDGDLVAEFLTSTGSKHIIKGKTVNFSNQELKSAIEYIEFDPKKNKGIEGNFAPFKNYPTMTIGFHPVPPNLENKLGTPDSHGCIRLRWKDWLILVPLFRSGTQVRVQK
jgi:lipoprotein-anchoring transpeptidase ErfK/SrfK